MSDKNRRLLFIWVGVGSVVIFVLVVVLIVLLNPNGKIPKDAYVVDEGLIVGEIQNAETLEKVREVLKKEPVLSKMPLTVEFYADDYSSYTKYTISYAFDFGEERGFYLVVKDYTGAGMGAALKKLSEMGMDTVGIKLEYEDLSSDSLSPKAE